MGKICKIGFSLPLDTEVTEVRLLKLIEFFVAENYTAYDGRLKLINQYVEDHTLHKIEHVPQGIDSAVSILDLIPVEHLRIDLEYNDRYRNRGLPKSTVDSIKFELEEASMLANQIDEPRAGGLELYLGAGFSYDNNDMCWPPIGWMLALKGDGRVENIGCMENLLEEHAPDVCRLREKLDQIFQCKSSFQCHYEG